MARFSERNLARCQSESGFNHTLASWHPSQWTNAIAGEAGEACNIAKKLLRHDQNIRGNIKADDLDRAALQQRCVKELADVIIYCDLAIQAMGGDTASTLREVFNNKSAEIGCGIII